MNLTLLEHLHSLSEAIELPSHDYLFDLADRCSTLLENERTGYRPETASHEIGGLLDFVSCQNAQKPLLIIPDLHARTHFLDHILNFKLPQDFVRSKNGSQMTLFEALSENLLYIVSVGDLLHSEMRGRERWLSALKDFKDGHVTGKAMNDEMKEGLSLLCMIMELKCAFPSCFHVLKGNHENIMNDRSEGNFPFKKFADEGEMVYLFMQEHYGDDVLMVISSFERSLPLLAAFPSCLISHAEPAEPYSRERIINGMRDSELIQGLSWTPNDTACDYSCKSMILELTGNPDALYFGGHRPVSGTCTFRQEGKYIQIHNPDREFVTLIYGNRSFDPDKNIIDVIK
ncbi:MAG: hypothetical protein IJL70_04750 [Treponema sp.]|nr:hypothetical protein [Treponema sp.]